MIRIAIVEDNDRLAALIQRGIAASGLASDVFPNMTLAWPCLVSESCTAAVIDRGLPEGDGLELVRRLRREGHHLPCLMLTARDALHDRVTGLEAGADDYLVKPFAMEELIARLRALMRRPAEVQELVFEFGGLRVEPDRACLSHQDETITLAPAELQILICLMRAEGRNVSRQRLEAAGWGVDTTVTSNALDVALHRLRKKLSAIGTDVQLVNSRNHGFALHAPDPAR